jgi:fucose 4-O-acetylase-like acetyltransferase
MQGQEGKALEKPSSLCPCFYRIWIVMACYVPVFFVCSGFTLKQQSNYTDFIVKKSKRLLLPYLFCVVLMTAFN